MKIDKLRNEILTYVKEYYDVSFKDDAYSEGDRIPFGEEFLMKMNL